MTPLYPESDLAVALASLDLPVGLDVVIGAAGGLGLLLVSLAAAPAFLGFAPTRTEIATPSRRVSFCARIALVPGVAGALIAVAFFLPDAGNGLIEELPLFGLFTIATVLAAPGTRSVEIPYDGNHQDLSWGLLATLVVTFLIFRFALARGITIPPDPEDFFFT